MFATDGAEEYGYGGASVRCHPEVVKALARHVHELEHQFVPADCWDETFAKTPGAVRLQMAYGDFQRRFSVKSSGGYHASKMEAGALSLAMRVLTRSRKSHRQRVLVLIDAKALLFGARNGRSSAPNFIHGLRAVSAHALAADIKLHCGYIASRFNPADPPGQASCRQKLIERLLPS